MPLTLIEAAKLETGNAVRRAIIELYADASDILVNLPFEDINGNALKYNREQALPGVGFRGVNEAYTPSTGVLNPQTENLVIAGGELDVDTFIVRTMGMQARSTQEMLKVRALGLAWTRKFLKGDASADPREFDGLQTRITGNQLVAAGASANGTALSLAKLDEAIDQTINPTHLLMSKAMRRRLTQAARNINVGGHISYDKDAFGGTVTQYNDLPIMTVDLDNELNPILPFTEAATATSIYVLSLGSGMVTGIQNGGRGVAIFAKACFGSPNPSKRQKSRDRYCLRRPSRPESLVRHPTRGGSHHPNDSTRCRDALHFHYAKNAS